MTVILSSSCSDSLPLHFSAFYVGSMMQQHFVYCGDEGVVSQQQTRRGDTEIWAPSAGIYKKTKKPLTLMENPSREGPAARRHL